VLGIGWSELAIIIAIGILLFGAPAIIGFWLGYRAGRKAGSADE
jgi:hypothetical protein